MPEERPAKVDGIIGVSDESVIAETVLDTKLFVSMIWGRARSKVVANPISPTHSKRQNMTAPTAHFAPKQMCQISLDCLLIAMAMPVDRCLIFFYHLAEHFLQHL